METPISHATVVLYDAGQYYLVPLKALESGQGGYEHNIARRAAEAKGFIVESYDARVEYEDVVFYICKKWFSHDRSDDMTERIQRFLGLGLKQSNNFFQLIEECVNDLHRQQVSESRSVPQNS